MNVPKKRGRRSAKEAEETRQQLLFIAMDQFCHHGYENVSLRSISSEGGVTHTSVLHHFGSKENIWKQVEKAIRAYVIESNRKVLESLDEGMAVNVALYQFCIRTYALLLLEPRPILFLYDGARQDEQLREYFDPDRMLALSGIDSLLMKYNEEYSDKPVDRERLGWKLLATGHSITYLKPLLATRSHEGFNYEQSVLEQWRMMNDHLANEFSVPEAEKLTVTRLEELKMPCPLEHALP